MQPQNLVNKLFKGFDITWSMVRVFHPSLGVNYIDSCLFPKYLTWRHSADVRLICGSAISRLGYVPTTDCPDACPKPHVVLRQQSITYKLTENWFLNFLINWESSSPTTKNIKRTYFLPTVISFLSITKRLNERNGQTSWTWLSIEQEEGPPDTASSTYKQRSHTQFITSQTTFMFSQFINS